MPVNLNFYFDEDILPHRLRELEESTSNSTVYWKARRERVLDCGRCKPHNGYDNKWSRHGRSDRYKSVRRGRCSGKVE